MDVAREQGLPVKMLYSVREVACVTGMSEFGVRKAVREGELRSKSSGQRVLMEPEWVDAWLARKEGAAR